MSPKVVCPPCNRVLEGKTDTGAEQTADKHNDSMHDEEEVARVLSDDVSKDELNDLMDHASDVCNPLQYEVFVQKVIRDYRNFGVLDKDEE